MHKEIESCVGFHHAVVRRDIVSCEVCPLIVVPQLSCAVLDVPLLSFLRLTCADLDVYHACRHDTVYDAMQSKVVRVAQVGSFPACGTEE